MQKEHVQVILGGISPHINDILPVIPSKRCYYVMALDKNCFHFALFCVLQDSVVGNCESYIFGACQEQKVFFLSRSEDSAHKVLPVD
jgi:hypothetical protein